jgi:two-component system chemotaxis response regulator CheY
MKALIVDDSRAMRMMIKRVLTPLGFDTAEAGDGREALESLQEGELPDVALVDVSMPVMDGLQLVSALRSNPDTRRITIMMVTSESEPAQIVRALANGAHEYLMKPFTPEAMAGKLAVLGLLPAEPVEAW